MVERVIVERRMVERVIVEGWTVERVIVERRRVMEDANVAALDERLENTIDIRFNLGFVFCL